MVELSDIDYFMNSWWPIVVTIVFSVISGIRLYMGGTVYTGKNRIDDNIVLITGASEGLGFQTAKELSKRGARVILTCRNEYKGKKALETIKKEVPNALLELKILDVSIMDDIRKFVKEFEAEYEKLDILINNAGIIFHPFQKTVEGNELTMATNYLGPFMLTHLLLPHLNKSDNGRVINITGLAHFTGKIDVNDINHFKDFQERDAYARSKLSLVLFTKQMASLYKKTKMTFNCVNPGLVRDTQHLRKSALKSSLVTSFLVWPWMWLFMKTPVQGSQTHIYAAVESTLNNVSGCYFSDCGLKKPSDLTLDLELTEELYKKTCELLKIDPDAILNAITTAKSETEYVIVQE